MDHLHIFLCNAKESGVFAGRSRNKHNLAAETLAAAAKAKKVENFTYIFLGICKGRGPIHGRGGKRRTRTTEAAFERRTTTALPEGITTFRGVRWCLLLPSGAFERCGERTGRVAEVNAEVRKRIVPAFGGAWKSSIQGEAVRWSRRHRNLPSVRLLPHPLFTKTKKSRTAFQVVQNLHACRFFITALSALLSFTMKVRENLFIHICVHGERKRERTYNFKTIKITLCGMRFNYEKYEGHKAENTEKTFCFYRSI